MVSTDSTPSDARAASELLRGLIALLGNARARFLFTRNFEGYPEVLTGDIDVFIERGDFERVRPDLEALTRQRGWGVFRQLRRPWLASYQLVRSDLPETARRVLVLEFFFGFTWRGFDYLGFADVWERRITHRGFPACDRLDGALTTLLHYFFWSGYVPRKYVPLVAVCLDAGQREDLRQRLRRSFPSALADSLLAELTGIVGLPEDRWRTRPNVFERIYVFPNELRRACRRHLIRQALRQSPLRLARLAFNTAACAIADLFRLGGTVLVLAGAESETVAVQVLREAKALHLYKNSVSQVCPTGDPRATRRAVWRTLIEGGLVVLPVRADAESVVCGALRFVPGRKVFRVSLDRSIAAEQSRLPGQMLALPHPVTSPAVVLTALVNADQRRR